MVSRRLPPVSDEQPDTTTAMPSATMLTRRFIIPPERAVGNLVQLAVPRYLNGYDSPGRCARVSPERTSGEDRRRSYQAAEQSAGPRARLFARRCGTLSRDQARSRAGVRLH